MDKVTAAAVLATPVFLDREATVDKACRLIEEAAAGGAGLVVFPETFVPTYPDWVWRSPPWGTAGEWFGRLLDQAVVVPSPATEARGAAARRAGVCGVAPCCAARTSRPTCPAATSCPAGRRTGSAAACRPSSGPGRGPGRPAGRAGLPTQQDPAAEGPPADHPAAAGPRPDQEGASHAR